MDLGLELYQIAHENGGLVTRAQSESVGVNHQRLTELARRGIIARVARGVWAVGNAPIAPIDPSVITRSCNVVLSDESTAAWLGVDLPRPPRLVHVTAPRNRGRRSNAIRGVRLHRASLGAEDVIVVRGVRVTSPLRTALDIGRRAALDEAVAIVDAFMRAGLLTLDEFVTAARRWQGPGRTRLLLIAGLIDPKSGSILESLTRVLLWRHDLPAPTSQHPFVHPVHGGIGRMDFAWPELKAILECDGYEFHSSREPFQKDRRRWTAIGTAGWHLAVVTWFDVTCDPQYVVAVVQELLALEVAITS